jgi:predicted DCC family thiol-disulfide oxidoreductase YuxK
MAPFPQRGSQASRLRAAVETHGHVLLYDGVCGLCNGFVQWVVKHDQHGSLRFATLQGEFGQEARARFPALADVDSVILVGPEGAMVRSTAVLEVARYLGGWPSLLLAGYLLPRIVRDGLYRWVARQRYGWFGRLEACPVPDAGTRERFLD